MPMSAGSEPFSFSATIAPTRLPASYRLGLVVVAAAMLLLPLLYVGLIGVTGAAVWWHLTENTWILSGRGGAQWRVVLYFAPAIAGLVIAFFMVKPILARPARKDDAVAIEPATEPTLFAFITGICGQVGAPVPRRVEVNCQVNASAGFKGGVVGMLTNDLVLTIGLPLVAGLSVRELGGVLAHEFGHFAQGGGMRLTGIVRGINAWFARVVYERDEWDQKLESWSRSNGAWQLSLILMLARGAVWITRQLLNGLMLGAHALSCFMMRQMEFDADSYEVKIAGTEAFVRTSGRMREMNLGARMGYSDLREGLRRGKLPSHLPAFLVERCSRIPADWLNQPDGADAETTGWFDTHPSDAERVAAARAAANPGVLRGGDGPAASLFERFDALSGAATRLHYEQDLGISLDDVTFIDTTDAIRQSVQSEREWQAVQQLLGENVSAYRPLHLTAAETHRLEPDKLRALRTAASAAMTETSAALTEQYREYEALDSQRDNAFAAQQLLGAGFAKVIAADFGLTHGTLEEAIATQKACDERQQALAPALRAFEAAAALRLLAAIHMRADGPLNAEVTQLIDACNALGDVVDGTRELRRLDFAFKLLQHNASESSQPPELQRQIVQTAALCASRIKAIRAALTDVACPSVLESGSATLAERCGLRANGQSAPAAEVIDRVFGLYFEVLGRLAALAIEGEAREAERAAGDARSVSAAAAAT